MTKRSYIDYLSDIRDAAVLAQSFVRGLSYTSFEENIEKQFAVIRAFEIMGEAAAHVPPEVWEQRPDVPWQDIVGMRNVLIHGYFGVDARVIWETLRKDVPALREAIEDMLNSKQ
jgi:uncharacterized protein with HEPN domain